VALVRLIVGFCIAVGIRNAARAKLRGGLTVVAVAITLVAFVLLRSLGAGWRDRIEQTPNDRVVTRHKIGWAGSLPVHYTGVVRQMPGVIRAVGGSAVGLKVPGQEGLFFQSFAIDAKDFVDMHYELSAPAEQKAAFLANRHGALVSAELAKERGWKVGDELHFDTWGSDSKWELTLSAIVQSTRVGFGQRAVWMHYEYFNESLPPPEQNRVSMIAAQIDDPSAGARMAQAIDIHFDSENDQTFSQEDKALNTALVGRFGAFLGAMNVVSLLVLGVVVLILGNSIAMSTREKTREFGTLRAIGFTPSHLAALVLGEAGALGLGGGALGLLLAYPLVQGPLSRYLEEAMGTAPLHVASQDALMALSLGVLLALLGAGLPALRAAQLEVTESLSYVA
jgi:putative ABC transport system permease protein